MSEKYEIKRDGARGTKNSGRGKIQKGDALLDIFTIDYKEYEKSFSISQNVWAKICMDAIRNNHSVPVLKVILGKGNGKTRLGVVSWDIIEDYIRLRQDEETKEIQTAQDASGRI
jgi:hypothetical protein